MSQSDDSQAKLQSGDAAAATNVADSPADADLAAYELGCQANTFGLLARLWVSELDSNWLRQLQDEPLGPAYQAVGGHVPETTDAAPLNEATSGEATSGEATSGEATSGEATSGEATSGEATSGEAIASDAEQDDPNTDLIETLAIEYCSCFLGPKGHLPPHQSVVTHSRFQGDCLSSMRKYVEIIGQPEGLFGEQRMLDQAGVQLHLMQRVLTELGQTVTTIGQLDPTDPEQATMLANQASLEQLRDEFYRDHLLWLIRYCEVAQQKTTSPFYAGLFRVTRTLLGGDPDESPVS